MTSWAARCGAEGKGRDAAGLWRAQAELAVQASSWAGVRSQTLAAIWGECCSNHTHPARRRPSLPATLWLRAQVIKQQLADGVSVRRVGFVSSGAPARQHSDITTPDGAKVGAPGRVAGVVRGLAGPSGQAGCIHRRCGPASGASDALVHMCAGGLAGSWYRQRALRPAGRGGWVVSFLRQDLAAGSCAQVGEVTSGAFSPCLKKNIAMG